MKTEILDWKLFWNKTTLPQTYFSSEESIQQHYWQWRILQTILQSNLVWSTAVPNTVFYYLAEYK